MYHINLLCDKVIWLKNGKAEKSGDPFDVVSAYESYEREKDNAGLHETLKSKSSISLLAYLERVEILGESEKGHKDPIRVRISVKTLKDIEYGLAVSLRRNDHVVVHTVSSLHDGVAAFRGDRDIVLEYAEPPLLSGNYYFLVYLMDKNLVNIYQDKMSPEFKVIKETIEPGICYLNHRWVSSDGQAAS